MGDGFRAPHPRTMKRSSTQAGCSSSV
jgi:hypothetical protein